MKVVAYSETDVVPEAVARIKPSTNLDGSCEILAVDAEGVVEGRLAVLGAEGLSLETGVSPHLGFRLNEKGQIKLVGK